MSDVALDCRMVNGPLHGIARYALELARRLPALAPDLHFTALTGPDGWPPEAADLRPDLPFVRVGAPFLSPLEQPALLAALTRLRPALFHATSFSLPALWPGPLVATLHDATHLADGAPTLAQRAYYRLVVRPRAHTARALITVSSFSRGALAGALGLAPERLQVIPNGVDERFRPPGDAAVARFRERHRLPARYLAAVGNAKPHKNLGVLSLVCSQLPVPLVLRAPPGTAAAVGLSGCLELPPLDDEELCCLYAGADAVLVPSRSEGFGLVGLEALAVGAPVVAADAGAHPEVLGGAARLVTPRNEWAWREAVAEVVGSPSLRAELSRAGLERAARFDWEACARQTLAVYRRALER